jgi:tRNA/rRNA methyltransferase
VIAIGKALSSDRLSAKATPFESDPYHVLDKIRVVLVEPSHPGNVGAVARALRVMGFSRLRVVAPRFAHILQHRDALALAAGADEILESAQVFDTLADALADCSLCVAVSAAMRDFGPPAETPEAIAPMVLAENGQCALVFGPERTGLSITDVGLCQRLCTIPTATEHSSLNLAQAVQVLAYVMRRSASELGAGALTDAEARRPDPSLDATSVPVTRYANHVEIENFYAHWERGLTAIRYLDPENPKKLMPRMRRLFSRSRLEIEDIHLLRGVCKLMEEAGEKWK